MATPKKPVQDKPASVGFNLRAFEAERTVEPFTVPHPDGKTYTLLSPGETDLFEFANVMAAYRENEASAVSAVLTTVVPEGDRDAFFRARITVDAGMALISAYNKHHGLLEPGKSDGS